jgi:hypothetical protein
MQKIQNSTEETGSFEVIDFGKDEDYQKGQLRRNDWTKDGASEARPWPPAFEFAVRHAGGNARLFEPEDGNASSSDREDGARARQRLPEEKG